MTPSRDSVTYPQLSPQVHLHKPQRTQKPAATSTVTRNTTKRTPCGVADSFEATNRVLTHTSFVHVDTTKIAPIEGQNSYFDPESELFLVICPFANHVAELNGAVLK